MPNINILSSVAYLNATVNVKPKTQNRRLEPTGLAKPGKIGGLTGTGPGLDRQESAGRIAWQFLTQTRALSLVPTRTEAWQPGTVANTTWRQSKTTRKSLRKKFIATQFARANNGIFAGADPSLDPMNTENDSEMKKEAEERKLHRMAKAHHFWRSGRAAKTYVLPRRNLAPKTSI